MDPLDVVMPKHDAVRAERAARVKATDVATVMYTSGTTGKPKGIVFTHENLVTKRFCRAFALPNVNEGDVFLCYLPLYHTFGRYLDLCGTLFWGATYVYARSAAQASLLEDFRAGGPRGVHHRRDVARLHRRGARRPRRVVELAALGHHLVEGEQPVPLRGGAGEDDDVLELRQRGERGQDLGELLLVRGEEHPRPGVVQHVDDLLGGGVGRQREVHDAVGEAGEVADTDLYWARSRVLEYLNQVQGRLPAGARAALGPDATGVGWIYQYALVDRSGRNDLSQLRALQDWFLKYELKSVPNVAEVATVGGAVREYQIVLRPDRLRAHGLTHRDVIDAVQASNQEAGGSVLELGEAGERRQHLRELLLVGDEEDARAGVLQHVDDLLGDGVGREREVDDAVGEAGEVAEGALEAVLGEDRDLHLGVAADEAEDAAGDGAGPPREVRDGEVVGVRAEDAHRDGLRVGLLAGAQELAEGVVRLAHDAQDEAEPRLDVRPLEERREVPAADAVEEGEDPSPLPIFPRFISRRAGVRRRPRRHSAGRGMVARGRRALTIVAPAPVSTVLRAALRPRRYPLPPVPPCAAPSPSRLRERRGERMQSGGRRPSTGDAAMREKGRRGSAGDMGEGAT